MKTKWKLFAISHYFSNDLSSEAAVALYDGLYRCVTEAASSSEIQELVNADPETQVWNEYEIMSFPELATAVTSLAHHAQEVEATDELA